MTLPGAITTCTVTVGKALDALGTEATILASITPDRALVWTATGDVIYPTTVTREGTSSLSFALPHVDQSGFKNLAGATTTMWSYQVKVTLTFPDGSQQAIARTVQPLVGTSTLDLDMLPGT